jgi:hypothetical protein
VALDVEEDFTVGDVNLTVSASDPDARRMLYTAVRRAHKFALSSYRDEQLRYLRPQRDLNPCYSLERAVSWAG